ncbi:MAG: methyl-accepting chemotaxis protein, partial [Euryarchaeota archaeon]|nr:methyl-accepting chemotaxis protein [Euryarchaeota archaeon]
MGKTKSSINNEENWNGKKAGASEELNEYKEFARKINTVISGIAQGTLNVKVEGDYTGELKSIKDNVNGTVDVLQLLIKEANMLHTAAVDGKLDTRANANQFKGDFKEFVTGVNGILDAVIGPLNVAADYVERISKGDIPEKISKDYKGDFNDIKNNLNKCIESVNGLIAEAGLLSKAAVEGRLETRGDPAKFGGKWADIVKGVNVTLDAVIGPLNVAAEYVDRISKGDIPQKITDKYNGDFNEIKNNLNVCIDALHALVTDAGILSKAAAEGKLSTRADVTKHQGDYQKIVEGVNKTLDGVIGPLNVAAEYIDRISKGDIPPKITDIYNGDFNEIKNNLNNCIGAVNNLVTDANLLAKAAVEGKLATRADATKHQGDWAKIVKGVDDCLDAVIGPLNVAAEYVDKISKGNIPEKITKEYFGDFNTIKNNLNNCIGAVNALVADANILAKAAADGKLATRADATKHQGDYQKIVKGVNETLDAVIGPLNVAAEYVDRISKGDIPPAITATYNGDFNEIKNNLNACIGAVNALVTDANLLAKAAVEGKLATRADATKHHGDWAKIVKGVDDCLDAVIGPLNVAAEYVDRISKGDIPPAITATYNGDFNEIKNNLNACIGAVNALVTDANLLAKAAVEGKLATRADATKHHGDFAKIVKGVDDCLDAVIGPLNVAAEYVDRISKGDIPPAITATYNGDFNEIKNNLNACIGAV